MMTDPHDNYHYFPQDGSFLAKHHTDFWSTRQGIDFWFITYRLKNGWKVVDFLAQNECGIYGHTWVEGKPDKGSDRPSVRMAYRLDWGCPLPSLPLGTYSFWVCIEGPLGTEY
jgi:hypothetical protein